MKVQEVEEVGKSDKGFTLVELLIVIVILGILATVTVFAVTGITNKGKTSACQSDAKTIQTAEEAYSANHGSYAATSQDLVDDGLMHAPSTKFNVFVHPAGNRPLWLTRQPVLLPSRPRPLIPTLSSAFRLAIAMV